MQILKLVNLSIQPMKDTFVAAAGLVYNQALIFVTFAAWKFVVIVGLMFERTLNSATAAAP